MTGIHLSASDSLHHRWSLPRWLLLILVSAAAAAALSIPLTLGAMGVNYATTFIDRAPIKAHIKEAFDTGELNPDLWAWQGVRGRHQYNDCMILHMAVRQSSDHWRDALGPNGPGDVDNPCQALEDFVKAPSSPPPKREDAYTRYLQGHTAVAAVAASVLSIGGMRVLFSRIAVLAVGGLLAMSFWRIARGAAKRSPGSTTRAAYVAVASLTLMLLYGFGGFSMSLNHFPEDMVVLGYLWFALFTDFKKMPRWALIATHTVFGVFTAWFEFLSGGLPLGACIICYMAAADASGSRAYPALRRAATSLAAYAASFLAAFAFKMVLTAGAFDPEVWSNFAEVTHRMAGGAGGDNGEAPPTLLAMVKAMLDNANVVAAGWRELGRTLIGLSFIGFGYALFVLFRRKLSIDELIQPGLLAAGFLAICAWHIAFFPHSTVHAFFMARTLVGLYFTSILLVASVHREDLRRIFGSLAALPSA